MTSESSTSDGADSSIEEESPKETMMQEDSGDDQHGDVASEDDSSDTDGGSVMDAEEEGSDEQAVSTAPTLSKSWAVQSRHIPLFTGGKITHCYTNGLATTSTTKSNEESEQDTSEEYHPFVILPVGGDLALVDSHRGITLGTVRGIAATAEPEDEDVEVDMDAITTYALSYNDSILMTCSHNTVIRQYALEKKISPTENDKNDHNDNAVVSLTKTWGKSGHTLPITHMEFHASNVFLATGSVDGTARIWDVRGGFVSHVFRPYQSSDGGGSGRLSVTALEWMPDIQHLVVAIGRDDGSIAIHDLRQDKQVTLLHEHVSSVVSMQWPLPLEEQQLFISSGRDSVVNVWKMDKIGFGNAKKRKKKKQLDTSNGYRKVQTLPVYEAVEGLVALPPRPGRTGVVVAVAGAKGCVLLYSYNSSSSQLELKAEQPSEEAFGEERGGYMRLAYNGSRKPVYSREQAKEEQLIVADAEHNIQFLSLSSKKHAPELATKRTIVGHNDDILDITVLPSGNHKAQSIAVATNSSQVRIFDLDTFSCHVLDGHSKTVLCVDVSPCGNFLASCGKDKEMRIWHIPSLSCCALAIGHSEAIGSTAMSRLEKRYSVHGKAAVNGGGAFVVTVSVDRTLKRWNLPGVEALKNAAEEGNELSLNSLASSRAHEKDINVVSVAPNDSFVATGSQDKTIKIWNSVDLTLRATLTGHRRGVWDCQFSPFDRVLASASGDKTVKLWSLGDFSCVRTFQGHLSSVLRVRFLSYGMQLASSGADGLVKVWTIRTNECETTLDGHNGRAWALDLSSDGKAMISGGADSRILVWEDITQKEEAAEHAKREEALMLDQRLANHIRHKEYSEALDITIQLDKPYQALKVFTAIIESNVEGGKDGIEPLRVLARGWSEEKMLRILQYCREWNTRARNCHVALLIVRAVVSTVPVHDLARMDGVPEIMAGIMPYAERHFERLDRLFESSFLIDFTLASMGSIGEVDSPGGDFNVWEASSKLVLPPVSADGRIQIGGNAVVGSFNRANHESDEDEIITIGESSDDDSISSDNSSTSSKSTES